MACSIQMRPDVTLATLGEDSRDFWSKDARIASANEMWRRFDSLNPCAENVNLGFTTCLISGDQGWGKSLLAVDIGVPHPEEGFRVVRNMADAAFGHYPDDPRDFHLLGGLAHVAGGELRPTLGQERAAILSVLLRCHGVAHSQV